MRITVRRPLECSPEYARLRTQFIYDPRLRRGREAVQDLADRPWVSSYLELWEGEILAAGVRLTPGEVLGPHGWLRGNEVVPFPQSPGRVDLTRAVVAPAYRRRGLCRLLLLLALEDAERGGAARVNLVVVIDLPHQVRLAREVGFVPVEVARPVYSEAVRGQRVRVLPLSCNLEATRPAREGILEKARGRLAATDIWADW